MPWLITAISILVTLHTTTNATKISELINKRTIETERFEYWLKDFKEIISKILTILNRSEYNYSISNLENNNSISKLENEISKLKNESEILTQEKEELIFLYNKLMFSLDLKDKLSTELLSELKELNKKKDLENSSTYSSKILEIAIKIINKKENQLKNI